MADPTKLSWLTSQSHSLGLLELEDKQYPLFLVKWTWEDEF